MVRVKAFDPDQALEAAMRMFWQRGFEATSMRDLLNGMSIGRGSFYDTFGDKRTLFLASLDRFEKVRTSWINETLEDSGLEGIEEVFRRTIEGLVEFEPRRGCLLANTAVELAPHDPEVAAKISSYIRRTEAAFERALIRARAAGEIPPDSDTKALSRFLVNNLHGMRVLARAGAERVSLEDIAHVALGALR
jgi:TetR/AcrR family transcriptional repressor of nem operon